MIGLLRGAERESCTCLVDPIAVLTALGAAKVPSTSQELERDIEA
jgi:hypothetical protein